MRQKKWRAGIAARAAKCGRVSIAVCRGKLNLREVEKARLEENEKWMAYLDANFQKQQAQLDC